MITCDGAQLIRRVINDVRSEEGVPGIVRQVLPFLDLLRGFRESGKNRKEKKEGKEEG
jgi:hypothetical protein